MRPDEPDEPDEASEPDARATGPNDPCVASPHDGVMGTDGREKARTGREGTSTGIAVVAPFHEGGEEDGFSQTSFSAYSRGLQDYRSRGDPLVPLKIARSLVAILRALPTR